MITCCVIAIILMVIKNDILISGALSGLMLWYNNVLPLLLPFILISNILVKHLTTNNTDSKTSKRKCFFTIILLGLLCGYPLGAKTAADFNKSGCLNKRICNILLPICNNVSPIFLAGYIVSNKLNNSKSLLFVVLIIYIPYILTGIMVYLITGIFQYKKQNKPLQSTPIPNTDQPYDVILKSIIQITSVGVYIMICTIISEFIFYIPNVTTEFKAISSGIIEITSGINYLSDINSFSVKYKTALILGITSFGGVSSILQTKNVITGSRLSIFYYIIIKVLCGFISFGLVLIL